MGSPPGRLRLDDVLDGVPSPAGPGSAGIPRTGYVEPGRGYCTTSAWSHAFGTRLKNVTGLLVTARACSHRYGSPCRSCASPMWAHISGMSAQRGLLLAARQVAEMVLESGECLFPDLEGRDAVGDSLLGLGEDIEDRLAQLGQRCALRLLQGVEVLADLLSGHGPIVAGRAEARTHGPVSTGVAQRVTGIAVTEAAGNCGGGAEREADPASGREGGRALGRGRFGRCGGEW